MNEELKKKLMDYLSDKIYDFPAEEMDSEIQEGLSEMAEDIYDLMVNEGVVNGN